MTDRYRSYWGTCEDTSHPPLTLVVEVHPDGGPTAFVPDPGAGDWEGFGIECPVCSTTVSGGFEGADETTTWERNDRRVAAAILSERSTMADYVRGYAAEVEGLPDATRATLATLAESIDAIAAPDPGQLLLFNARRRALAGARVREATT